MVMEDNKIPKCGCCHTGENISETDFGYTLSLINGKYKLVIIYWLEQHYNVMRYSELKRCLGNISHKTLSSTLKEMESDGLIIRKEYQQIPPKVEYSLSKRGMSLIPILVAMCEWGSIHKND
jgi:DNA-binding HxlR family transcriptional regulator